MNTTTTLTHAPNSPLIISAQTDFLQEAWCLEHDYAMAQVAVPEQMVVLNDDQIESKVLIENALGNFKDLLYGLLANVARYRQDGAALLLGESHNKYTVMPWQVPASNLSVEQMRERLRRAMDTDPNMYGVGVTQVFYAWRLRTKYRPVLLFAEEVCGAVVMCLHDARGWHQLQPISPVIELALRCARPAPSSLDWYRSLECTDHDELKRRYGDQKRLGPILHAMDDEARTMSAENRAWCYVRRNLRSNAPQMPRDF